MKKMLAALALCAVCVAPALWADEIVGLMSSKDVISYNYLFPKNKKEGGKLEVSLDYTWDLCDKHYENLAPLGGSNTDIDTEEEFLYASYICPGVITSRPVQAAQILPKSHDSDVKVAALMYQNLQLATFLKSSNASAYAALFNEFCTDNKVSKAEVKTYFDRNIVASIAAEVDAQFKGAKLPPSEIQAVKDILTMFFISPNTGTFNAVRDVRYIYDFYAQIGENTEAYRRIANTYGATLGLLSDTLARAVIKDIEATPRVKSGSDNVVAIAAKVKALYGM